MRHPVTGRFMAGDCERDCLEHCAGLCGAQVDDADPTMAAPTMGLLDAAKMLGIGRDAAYGLAHTGWLIEDQVPVWHMRGQFRVPTVPLHRALGIEPPAPTGPPVHHHRWITVCADCGDQR